MADTYETKVKVTADTSDAKKKLGEVGNVSVTVGIKDDDAVRRLEELTKDKSVKIKVTPDGVSEKDGKKFKIEFNPDDTQVKARLREITGSKHTVIVGMKAKWDVAQDLYKELQPPTDEFSVLSNEIQNAGDKGVEAGKKTAKSFDGVTGSVKNSQQALKSFNRIAARFAIVTAIIAIVRNLKTIVDSFKSAEKAKRELFESQVRTSEAIKIGELASQYNRLADAINSAAAAEKHHLEMIDQTVAGRRRLAAAEDEAAKQREIAALDTTSPYYEEERKNIEQKYADRADDRNGSNAVEDLVLGRQKLNSEADQIEEKANAQEANTKRIKAALNNAKREQMRAETEAIDLNDKDKDSALSYVSATSKQLFSFEWGRMGSSKTTEGDAVRLAAKKEAGQRKLEVQRLEEELRQSENKTAELRKDASRKREEADAMGTDIQAAQVEAEAKRAARNAEPSVQSALADRNQRDALARLTTDIANGNAESAWQRNFANLATPAQRLEALNGAKAKNDAELAAARAKYDAEMKRPEPERDTKLIDDLAAFIREAAQRANGYDTQIEATNREKLNAAESRADQIRDLAAPSQNRLTAMGLGSGVSADRYISDISIGVRDLVRLSTESLSAIRDLNATPTATAAKFL